MENCSRALFKSETVCRNDGTREHAAFDQLIQSARLGYRSAEDESTATVMFTDIANSTHIANMLGDRVWATTITLHLETLSGVIEENGGKIVKTLGDGTMSTFSSARAAMSAAKKIQNIVAVSEREPRLEVRIGVHTGDVIQSDGDFFGNVVNKAARIASSANPGQILVSDATRVMVGSDSEYSFGDPASVNFKGIEGAHSVLQLHWT